MTSLPSGLADIVGSEEDLARFLTQSGHFNEYQVRPSAFLPSKRSRETSVSRHGQKPLDALISLGRAAAGERSLYGAALLKGRNVEAAGLEVVADEPPARHAAIRNWPWLDDDPENQKAQQKERALLLASAAGAPLLFNLN
jgi:hypothetical protein